MRHLTTISRLTPSKALATTSGICSLKAPVDAVLDSLGIELGAENKCENPTTT